MLDALKNLGSSGNKPTRQQSDELQALIASSREERAALSTMLTQIQLHSAKLATAGKTLAEVEEKATHAHTRLDEVTERLSKADARARELETIDARIRGLVESVAQAERDTGRLTAPDGELQKQKDSIDTLAAQASATRDSLEALKKDQAALEPLREHLRESQAELQKSRARADALNAQYDELRKLSGNLSQEFGKLQDVSRATHEETTATVEMVGEVEKKLGSLTEFREMSRTTDERLATLNALAEHVTQKIKALENQKHTVEHAVVESNRLNEMIWNMDVQITKLNEAAQQATRVEELIDRVENLSHDVSAQLDSAASARDGFTMDLAKLERDRTSLTDFVRGYVERMANRAQGLRVLRPAGRQPSGVARPGGTGDGSARRARGAGGVSRSAGRSAVHPDSGHDGRRGGSAAQAGLARCLAGIAWQG